MAPTETLEGGELAPTPALSISLSPQGHVHVDAPAGSDVTSSLAQIARHFERGDGHGVFRLGAAEPETPLPGVLGFWRDVGRAFVVRLCATEDLETLRAKIDVEVPPDALAALAAASPPMIGGEYLTPAVLAELCAHGRRGS
jgi:non-specific serine/threonine protein kinase